jgi:hypothetical protein
MADIVGLRSEFLTLLINTINATANEKQKLRNRFITEHNSLWLVFLATNGGVDTAQLRGEFVAYMLVEELKRVYTTGSVRESQEALPPPETL